MHSQYKLMIMNTGYDMDDSWQQLEINHNHEFVRSLTPSCEIISRTSKNFKIFMWDSQKFSEVPHNFCDCP